MAELDKVINGLKCCTHAKAPIPCGDCSYFGNIEYNDVWSCRIAVMRDALELLKRQEAVTIKKTKEHGFGVYGGVCPKCNNWIQSAHSFCGFCGKAVKWDV